MKERTEKFENVNLTRYRNWIEHAREFNSEASSRQQQRMEFAHLRFREWATPG